jgi:hypothetical protein
MPIHTSAIFYGRGVPNKYTNFAYVAQTNNVIPQPMHKYLQNYNFITRTIPNIKGYQLMPWSN